MQKGDWLLSVGGTGGFNAPQVTPLSSVNLGKAEYHSRINVGVVSVGTTLARMMSDRFALGAGFRTSVSW